MAIAFTHILPEEQANWLRYNDGVEKYPLPESLLFIGYTLILVLDKVLFNGKELHEMGKAAEGASFVDPAALKLS